MKKVVSLVLTIGITLSFVACSSKGFSEKKLVNYAKKELELEEVDTKAALKKIEKLKKQDYYFYADSKETKKVLWKNVELEDYLASPKGVESTVCVITGKPETQIELATVITFDSEDNAVKFMDKTEDFWDDSNIWDDYYCDKNSECLAGVYESESDEAFVLGVYRQGRSVLVVIGADNGDADFDVLEGVCEIYKVEYVEDLV